MRRLCCTDISVRKDITIIKFIKISKSNFEIRQNNVEMKDYNVLLNLLIFKISILSTDHRAQNVESIII